MPNGRFKNTLSWELHPGFTPRQGEVPEGRKTFTNTNDLRTHPYLDMRL